MPLARCVHRRDPLAPDALKRGPKARRHRPRAAPVDVVRDGWLVLRRRDGHLPGCASTAATTVAIRVFLQSLGAA
jgi:hypothetical protein